MVYNYDVLRIFDSSANIPALIRARQVGFETDRNHRMAAKNNGGAVDYYPAEQHDATFGKITATDIISKTDINAKMTLGSTVQLSTNNADINLIPGGTGGVDVLRNSSGVTLASPVALRVEDTNPVLALLSPDSNVSSIYFGNPTDPDQGYISMNASAGGGKGALSISMTMDSTVLQYVMQNAMHKFLTNGSDIRMTINNDGTVSIMNTLDASGHIHTPNLPSYLELASLNAGEIYYCAADNYSLHIVV